MYPRESRASPARAGTPDPNNPAKLDVTTSHPAVAAIHAPRCGLCAESTYVPGTAAPFITPGADGPDRMLFTALDRSGSRRISSR